MTGSCVRVIRMGCIVLLPTAVVVTPTLPSGGVLITRGVQQCGRRGLTPRIGRESHVSRHGAGVELVWTGVCDIAVSIETFLMVTFNITLDAILHFFPPDHPL